MEIPSYATVLTLILALGISTVVNDIGPLLGYISPAQAMYQACYTYDRMINTIYDTCV